jgi:RHS repeat-associated protein
VDTTQHAPGGAKSDHHSGAKWGCHTHAGQYTDTETGLQWVRARYYDPTTAQFLTVDLSTPSES